MTVRKNEAEAEGDAADPTHRLTDIEVDEVSLVDRAANGRRYTVVKAADGEDKDDEEPEAGYKADGDKADDKGDEAEAGKAEGEDAGDKADDAPDSAEKAEPEDEDPAEGEAAAEGDDEPEEEEAQPTGIFTITGFFTENPVQAFFGTAVIAIILLGVLIYWRARKA